jgi:hypothetical protein
VPSLVGELTDRLGPSRVYPENEQCRFRLPTNTA